MLSAYTTGIVSIINNYLNSLADILCKFHYYCACSPSVRLFTSAWIAEAVALGEHLSGRITVYFNAHRTDLADVLTAVCI